MSSSQVTLSSYQLRLPSFEGPLDVLLTLIEREQLEISDLSLVAVTDGFLMHIESMENPPPTLLADFLGVAARLLVLKSRALLPRPDLEDAIDEVDDLAGQLREYQRMKRVAAELAEHQSAHWRSYARHAPPPARPSRIVFTAPPVTSLGRSFLRAIARQPVEPENLAMRRVVSVAEMAGRLYAAVIGRRGGRRFLELVNPVDREEVVAGFIAMLALWRRRQIDLRQDALFGDIHIEARSTHEGSQT